VRKNRKNYITRPWNIEFLRAVTRFTPANCGAMGERNDPIDPLLCELQTLPYGVFLANTLDPICVVGKQSCVLGRSASPSEKPGGSRNAISRGDSVGSRGEKVTLRCGDMGEHMTSGEIAKMPRGLEGGENSFLTNFLCTYLSSIQRSRDSLSAVGLGFFLSVGILTSSSALTS